MKKILMVILAISISTLPYVAFAGLGLPFGGQIVLVHQPPNTICTGDAIASPFTMKPVTPSPIGPWSVNIAGPVHVGTVVSGAWILGLYTPTEECEVQSGPFAGPLPTSGSRFYGTSVPGI